MKKIVLIDDDIDDADLFREALERANPPVSFHYFNGGSEAFENLLVEENALPDIIFLDINMPRISGWECLTRFRETKHLKFVPVIIYSTSSQAGEINKAAKLGATGFISKPDDFARLKEMLSTVIGGPAGQLAETLQKYQCRAAS